MRADDLIVIDLLDGGRSLPTDVVARVYTKTRALLVTGTNPIAPGWLGLSGNQRVQAVRCPGCSIEPFVNLVATIEAELSGPTRSEIAAHVFSREPRFASAADVVKAILAHPWEVRRPAQLATLTDMGVTSLRRLVGTLGFRRVEHFIVAVRLIAFEELVSRHRVSLPAARRMVGLIDPSNVSRQLRRAQVGSPGAFRDLAVSRA